MSIEENWTEHVCRECWMSLWSWQLACSNLIWKTCDSAANGQLDEVCCKSRPAPHKKHEHHIGIVPLMRLKCSLLLLKPLHHWKIMRDVLSLLWSFDRIVCVIKSQNCHVADGKVKKPYSLDVLGVKFVKSWFKEILSFLLPLFLFL